MAGPTKYSEDVVERLEQAIRLGATYTHACNYAGISTDTFNRWKKSRAAFAARIKRAEGAATIQWLAKIEQAASDGNWQAAAWKLERRYPQEYGRRVHEHQGANAGPMQIQVIYGDDGTGSGGETAEADAGSG